MTDAATLRGIALALAIGGAGGFVFFTLHLPLAWMLGAMSFVTVAAMAGARVAMPRSMRSFMIAVLGTLLGSSFTPDVADRMSHWGGGVLVVVAFVGVATALSLYYLRRIGGIDRITAYFSSTPGGLGEMALAGELAGADTRTVSLVHATRILFVVFTIPLYMRFVAGHDAPRLVSVATERGVADARELAILAAAALAGFLAARAVRIPSAQLLGPLVFSATAYGIGLVEGRPPVLLLAVAQVVVGAALGARFVGFEVRVLGRVMLLAVGSAVGMVAAAAAVSRLAAPWIGADANALLLALAPGGLAEMALVALSMDIDTAFVSTMHIVRIMMIVIAAPLVFRLLGWRGT